MQLSQYDSVYFLGIGGIGMSALARWFHHKGLYVSGYDITLTPLTRQLVQEGIPVHTDDDIAAIRNSYTREKTLVVYTPAIPRHHAQLNYLQNNDFTVLKRSQVLGIITKNHKTVAVSGTHGKTTTSALIAHILKCAGMNTVAFLGGITVNYETNLVTEGTFGKDTLIVTEADEFDRSFLNLSPDIAVVTSIDPDHLDTYGSVQNLHDTFSDFIGHIKEEGTLVIHESIPRKDINLNISTYGIDQGQFFATEITTKKGTMQFDLLGFSKKMEHVTLPIPGLHNVENTIAAIVVSGQLGIDIETIRESLNSFRGIKRRFEYIINRPDLVYIDDYAHHPVEISCFIASLRFMYPEKHITIIFQPHLYTRTKEFAKEFANSLSMADTVLLLDIYPAREKPIPGVTSGIIFNSITSKTKIRCSKEEVLNTLETQEPHILATVGAGDIDILVEPIKELINNKYGEA